MATLSQTHIQTSDHPIILITSSPAHELLNLSTKKSSIYQIITIEYKTPISEKNSTHQYVDQLRSTTHKSRTCNSAHYTEPTILGIFRSMRNKLLLNPEMNEWFWFVDPISNACGPSVRIGPARLAWPAYNLPTRHRCLKNRWPWGETRKIYRRVSF